MAGFKFETEIKLDKMINSSDIERAQRKLINEVREKSDSYVPWLTGRLRNQVNTSKYIITYKAFNGGHMSYAARQYYTNAGLGKQGLHNGGKRGSQWTERMWNEQKDAICEEIKKELLGGK